MDWLSKYLHVLSLGPLLWWIFENVVLNNVFDATIKLKDVDKYYSNKGVIVEI